jgi:hypothetical protein
MKKYFLNRIFLIMAFGLLLPKAALATDKAHICEGEYALCTTAKCSPIPGQSATALCNCQMKKGYSVGYQSCPEPTITPEGFKTTKSRYYPIKDYVSCSNNRAWAFCLDSPCIVDKNDPSKAICTCSTVQGKGDYMIVSSTCDKAGCESDFYSSALLTQNKELELFLQHPANKEIFLSGQKRLCE